MKKILPSVAVLFLAAALSLPVLAVQVHVPDFMSSVGLRLDGGVTEVEVGQEVRGTVSDPAKLKKHGVEGAVKDAAATVTFKREKMVEIVFPSLKKKAFFAMIDGKWELQAIQTVKV